MNQSTHREEIDPPKAEEIVVEMSQHSIRFELKGSGEFRTTAKMFHVLRDALAGHYDRIGNPRPILLIGYASRREANVPVLRDPQFREFFFDALESFRSGVEFINEKRYLVLARDFTEAHYFRARGTTGNPRKNKGSVGGDNRATGRDHNPESARGAEDDGHEVTGAGD